MKSALAALLPLSVAVALSLTAAACGGGQDHCAQSCDRVAECGAEVKLSFTCGETTAETCDADETWHDCSHCVLDASCDDLKAGACASACP